MVALYSREDCLSTKSPRFDGPKICSPIHYSERWHHLWLVQLSLDQNVRRISAPDVGWSTEEGSLSLLLELTEKPVARALGVRRRTAESDRAGRGGMIIVLRDDIRQHILRDNALAIWRWRDYPLSLQAKFSILTALNENGSWASLGTLLILTEMDAGDLIAAVCRLRIEGLLHFSLEEVLCLETQVRIAKTGQNRPESLSPCLGGRNFANGQIERAKPP